MSWLQPPAPRTVLALLVGLLWALAFPHFGWTLCAWLAPGLLLLAGLGVSVREAMRLGYLAGLVHNLVALYWLLNIPFAYGNVAGWLALSAYCALFPAIWMGLCHRAVPGRKAPVLSATATPGTEPFSLGAAPLRLRGRTWEALRDLLDANWIKRQWWLLLAALSWVGLEFFRGWFLSGFPWNFLAASQFKSVPLIQLAGITGVHGVSFIIVWVSLSLATAAATVAVRPQTRFAWKNELTPALIILLVIISWGVARTTRPLPASDRSAKLALVQPSIPQTLIFDPAAVTNRFNHLLELSARALATEPDALIWPEASLPAIDLDSFERFRALIRGARTPVIFGADDAERIQDGPRERYLNYNAAFLFGGNGAFQSRYRKQRLVIFGEYTPGARWLPFLADWFPAGQGFATGEAPENFRIFPLAANVMVNICFEDNFTDLVRAQVRPDTDFVLNLTNNGWFGESAAQWQHAANAVFRAVENGVPLVRCTNNGLTCWIDEQGRLREVFRDDQGSVYGSGIAVFEVPLLPSGTAREPTFYAQFGDWFAWLCLAVVAGQIMAQIIHDRRWTKV